MATLTPVISQRISPESTQREHDSNLLAAVGRGDRHAFSSLYRQFSGNVHRIVHAVVRDPAQAEEITQEVFLTIWREAFRFDPTRGSPSGYISMLAHSKAVDRVRSSQAARARDDRYRTRNVERHEQHDPVIESALMWDERQQIRTALTGLSSTQRQAIELYYFGRRTYQEVGDLLGVSQAAVKQRVRSAVLQLRNQMAQAG